MGTNHPQCIMELGKTFKNPIYRRWNWIKGVVYNETSPDYFRYGGRGIQCYWDKKDFDSFQAYVLKKLGPPQDWRDRLSRKNHNGDFAPGNLEWTDHHGTARKQHTCVYLTYKRKKQTMMEWSKELNIAYETITMRHKKGWSTPEILGFKQRKQNGKRT